MGSEKIVHEREKQIRSWAHRSVVSVKKILKGERITEEMLWTKRPGTGIPSSELHSIIGKIATEEIPANTLIRKSQFL